MRVPLASKHRANGLGNVRAAQSGCGNLVEQGLEEMVIGAIDDQYFTIELGEALGTGNACKASTQNDDAAWTHGDETKRSNQ